MLRTLSDALRPQALLGFDLPLAPPQVDELPALIPGAEALCVRAPAGTHLLLISVAGPLSLAFEAALFDLLAEHRFPSPPPRRARGGALIAQLKGPDGPAAAACYPWPAGHALAPAQALVPQLLEVGRMLARLHQLGSAHPASVADPCDSASLAARLPAGAASEQVAELLRRSFAPLPMGALHGHPGPAQFLFIGERPSGLLPSGAAHSGPLLLDLAEAMVGWALSLEEPLPALRALVSGYQSLRRLTAPEKASLHPMLVHAAARADARVLIAGRRLATDSLTALQALREDDVRALAG
jgi:Ser/Thr protein kinase RdoA (MazF antagonist)